MKGRPGMGLQARRHRLKFPSACSVISLVTCLVGAAAVRAQPAAAAAAPAPSLAPGEIRFNRDVRPILAENCYACHGPDQHQRKGDLRLDTKEGLFNKVEDVIPVA